MHGVSGGNPGHMLNKREPAAPHLQGDNSLTDRRRLLHTETAWATKANSTAKWELQKKKCDMSELTPASLLLSILQIPTLSLPPPMLQVHYFNSQQNHN